MIVIWMFSVNSTNILCTVEHCATPLAEKGTIKVCNLVSVKPARGHTPISAVIMVDK